MRISFARVHGRTTEHIAPLITTLVDGTGLVIYFEIARRVLAL